MTNLSVGIDKLSMYVPRYYIDMVELAKARDVDPDKYTIGIGQDAMAVPPVDQDVISMGANAASRILDDEDRDLIDQVIFATESSMDFSKAASTYLVDLLRINRNVRAYELKQACYSGTIGLLIACDYVRLHPDRKVLVVTSDIARYGLATSGEPTQGAGAMAMIVSANPRIMSIDPDTYPYAENAYDFWRPFYSDTAFVQGKYSTDLYIDVFVKTLKAFEQAQGDALEDLKALVLHLPFTKMAKKALAGYVDQDTLLESEQKARLVEGWLEYLPAETEFSRQIGNIYTGSLYLGLLSLLVHSDQLQAGDRLGLFSYGSGATGEFFTATLAEDFDHRIEAAIQLNHLASREKISIPDYEEIFNFEIASYEDKLDIPQSSQEHGYYLDYIENHQRFYNYEDTGDLLR